VWRNEAIAEAQQPAAAPALAHAVSTGKINYADVVAFMRQL
jgi:hypothetical protein